MFPVSLTLGGNDVSETMKVKKMRPDFMSRKTRKSGRSFPAFELTAQHGERGATGFDRDCLGRGGEAGREHPRGSIGTHGPVGRDA